MRKRGEGSSSGKEGFSLVELVVVVLIISILAAIAQPKLSQVLTKARAADALADLEVIRLAVYAYQADQNAWPGGAGPGQIPAGLDAYLPANFSMTKSDYTLDIDAPGAPFAILIDLITTDSMLGLTLMDMLPAPKWALGNEYTWAIE